MTTISYGQRIPLSDFSFAPKPEIEISMLTMTTTTTNVAIEGELEFTDEQQEELTKWWTEVWERELMRQIMGQPSEYAESLRAAKAEV
jgi:hypothetical protein